MSYPYVIEFYVGHHRSEFGYRTAERAFEVAEKITTRFDSQVVSISYLGDLFAYVAGAAAW